MLANTEKICLEISHFALNFVSDIYLFNRILSFSLMIYLIFTFHLPSYFYTINILIPPLKLMISLFNNFTHHLNAFPIYFIFLCHFWFLLWIIFFIFHWPSMLAHSLIFLHFIYMIYFWASVVTLNITKVKVKWYSFQEFPTFWIAVSNYYLNKAVFHYVLPGFLDFEGVEFEDGVSLHWRMYLWWLFARSFDRLIFLSQEIDFKVAHLLF